MTLEKIVVNMGNFAVAKHDYELMCLGIGSCVVLVLIDGINKVYGMAHIMLGFNREKNVTSNPNRYAENCIPNMLSEMIREGAYIPNLKAKLAGGAHMFASLPKDRLSINTKNVDAVKTILKNNRRPLLAEDVGGNHGRTIIFNTDTEEFKVLIRADGTEKLL